MVVRIHDGNSPAAARDIAVAQSPGPVPVFVDATGRRARLMRRCGVLLAAGALVYVPIVGLAVLTGPSVPQPAPLLDDETGMETADQAPEQGLPPLPPVIAGASEVAGGDLGPAGDSADDAGPWPPVLAEPGPVRDEPGRGSPSPGPGRGPSHPSPSTAGPTPPSASPSPSPTGTLPSPSPQTPPPVTPTAPALLDAARRYLA
ncbi:hypothetical protein [Micromonospora globbae]|uniref:hypothetical protein n=1 Tax=Micromonospora globbae TaxID=1894969 RepID=UPI00341D0BAB